MASAAAVSKVAFVSGGNRGVGLGLVRELARVLDDSAVILLGSRSLDAGAAAAAQVAGEAASGRTTIRAVAFDLNDEATMDAVAATIFADYGGLDYVFLNAGMAILPADDPVDIVRPMIAANNVGNQAALDKLAPLVRDNGRICVTASGFGTLGTLSDSIRPRVAAAAEESPAAVLALLEEYAAAVVDGSAAESGWPEWVNVMSKVGQVAALRAFVKAWDASSGAQGVRINAVCPGWTNTDAARPYLEADPELMAKAKTPDEAAVDIVWLGTLAPGEDGPHGELVQYRKVIAFDGSASA